LDSAENFLAINPLERGVCIRKVVSDIPFSCCAQERVGDGMREDIGVGMTVETAIVKDFNSAKDQLAAFGETMHIISNSNAIHG
jgi:hypothetical protein